MLPPTPPDPQPGVMLVGRCWCQSYCGPGGGWEGGLPGPWGRACGRGLPGKQGLGLPLPSGLLRTASMPPPTRPQEPGTNWGIFLENRKKRGEKPTHVVLTQDSDMLTSLLYRVSNLNTDEFSADVGSQPPTILSGASGLPLTLAWPPLPTLVPWSHLPAAPPSSPQPPDRHRVYPGFYP